MYEYKCIIVKILDGDTVDVDIDLGFGVWLRNERVRILGIDTPESRTRDKIEKKFGYASKDYIVSLMDVGSTQTIKTVKDGKGKFGRILGDFVFGDKTLTELMILNHHAVPYHGQNKKDIQLLHEANRQILIANGTVTLD